MSGSAVFAAITGSSSVTLISLESPTNLSALGSDPPEDLTLLRIVGDLTVTVTGAGEWRLALLVQDRTWTASAVQADDNDKRVLWSAQFSGFSPTDSNIYWASGLMTWNAMGADPSLMAARDNPPQHIDIAPRVKVEAGKTLYLVAYEVSNGATLTVSSQSLRVLYQRSGRR